MNFRLLQERQYIWSKKNFPNAQAWEPLLGAVEELSELAHAHLKQHQNIRIDEDHEAQAKDSVADIIICLCHYCSSRDFDLQEIMECVWGQVEQRNWKENKINGEE